MRRIGSLLWRAGLFALGTVVVAEIALQGAALFARDRATERPAAQHRILCVGDSHTFGALVPVEDSYPGQLQRLLDAEAPGAWAVVNLGIPGLNTTQVRERLRARLDTDRPDLVVAWCGVNNAWNRAEASRLADALFRLRIYRLLRVWWHDRTLERGLARGPAARGRYDVVDPTGRADPHHRLMLAGEGRGEEIEFRDTGLRADAEMEEQAARDYRRMVEDSAAAGARIVFVTYPVESKAFAAANRAIRRVAEERCVPVIESSLAAAGLPAERRRLLWAGHPDGPIYAEIARAIVPLVPGGAAGQGDDRAGALARLTFDAGAGGDAPDATGAPTATGPCGRTTDCAPGGGCYRWNPHGTICNLHAPLSREGHAVWVSARLRVTAFPTGMGGHDVLGLTEGTYGTGVHLELADTDRLQVLSQGNDGARGVCGPLRARLLPDTWYGVRMRAQKCNRATVRLDLLGTDGALVDSVGCADQPAGGGYFTQVVVGSSHGSGATADVTLDDVDVRADGG